MHLRTWSSQDSFPHVFPEWFACHITKVFATLTFQFYCVNLQASHISHHTVHLLSEERESIIVCSGLEFPIARIVTCSVYATAPPLTTVRHEHSRLTTERRIGVANVEFTAVGLAEAQWHQRQQQQGDS